MPHLIAFDLGAESGRTILGTLENKKLEIRELNRFPNRMIRIAGHLHWNILQLFEEMKNGLKIFASQCHEAPLGLAVDTWGVDFALLGKDGSFIGFPFAYRDGRTNGMMEEAFKVTAPAKIYGLTGIQFMQINTIFQLFSMVRDKSWALDAASDLLLMPDIFTYLFSGEKKSEACHASTSQLYNPSTHQWADELFSDLGIPRRLMQQVVQPGTVVGKISYDIAQETGVPQIPFIASASHDTASAVAAVPSKERDWAFISCGTWSLMGIEVDRPILHEKAMRFNFTNEGGVQHTIRFLKNILGLWIVQECRRIWSKDRPYGYEEMTQMAAYAPKSATVIDPQWNGLLNPGDMPQAIADFCRATEQTVPASRGDMLRCILQSLALEYRYVLDQLREMSPDPVRKIHMIGGGIQNKLLCQFTAEATGLPVIAGPVEATAIGNLLVQALGLGYFSSLSGLRECVIASFCPMTHECKNPGEWDDLYEHFRKIKKKIRERSA